MFLRHRELDLEPWSGSSSATPTLLVPRDEASVWPMIILPLSNEMVGDTFACFAFQEHSSGLRAVPVSSPRTLTIQWLHADPYHSGEVSRSLQDAANYCKDADSDQDLLVHFSRGQKRLSPRMGHGIIRGPAKPIGASHNSGERFCNSNYCEYGL